MRLAPDPIIIRIGGEGVALSPSLRVAMRTIAKHHEFPTVLRGVLDGNITVIADLIAEGSGDHAHADRLFAEIAKSGLRTVLSAITDTMTEFVLALAGYDADAPAQPSTSSGPSLTITDYHAKLFEIATGWLGWAPADAWAASPSEIEAAYNGRADMLKAIYGEADKKPKTDPLTPERRAEIEAAGLDPEFDREGLQRLKAKIARAG